MDKVEQASIHRHRQHQTIPCVGIFCHGDREQALAVQRTHPRRDDIDESVAMGICLGFDARFPGLTIIHTTQPIPPQ